MKQPELNIDPIKPAKKTKPEPIEKWENEGGQIIPTGPLPKVTIPVKEEDKAQSRPRH